MTDESSAPPAPTFVLVHSPLLGLTSWAFVANELWERDVEVIVPGLHHAVSGTEPFWTQHVASVVRSIETLAEEAVLLLVAHSGAGLLLPAIAEAAPCRVAGYIFVDADLPEAAPAGMSRLDTFPDDAARAAFRGTVVDGMVSPFTEDTLAELIPDASVRTQVAEELRPMPLTVYEERVSVPPGWPDAPVAYLGFRKSRGIYAASLERARHEGWPFSELRGSHLHPAVDPKAVAEELLRLADAMDLR